MRWISDIWNTTFERIFGGSNFFPGGMNERPALLVSNPDDGNMGETTGFKVLLGVAKRHGLADPWSSTAQDIDTQKRKVKQNNEYVKTPLF